MDRYEEFREFFAVRRAALSRTAFFLTGDHGAAEDLLQEALMRTLNRWSRLTSEASAEAYVRRVLLNESRARWRRRYRRPEVVTAELEDRSDGVDVAAEAAQRSVLGAAVRQVAVRQRAVLYLRYYEDRSITETARLLGCSEGTVKSQAHDALAILRRLAPELDLARNPMEVTE